MDIVTESCSINTKPLLYAIFKHFYMIIFNYS